MVMLRLAALALTVSAVVADITITKPATASWWVAGSSNTLEWDCKKDATKPAFTVSLRNSDPSILPGTIDVIAIQQDYDCSKTITREMVSQAPGPGYQVLFANPLNRTDIWGTSEEFEIKPVGSSFPAQGGNVGVSSSGGAASATDSTAEASQSALPASSAGKLQASAVVGLVAAGVLALAL